MIVLRYPGQVGNTTSGTIDLSGISVIFDGGSATTGGLTVGLMFDGGAAS